MDTIWQLTANHPSEHYNPESITDFSFENSVNNHILINADFSEIGIINLAFYPFFKNAITNAQNNFCIYRTSTNLGYGIMIQISESSKMYRGYLCIS